MITLEYIQETAKRNVAVEERLEHIIDVMTDCDVAMSVPTDAIAQWRYAPERSCVIAEKEYKDHYEDFDQWESYSIPVECLEMSDEELKTLFEAEADIRDQQEHQRSVDQLKRDAANLGYTLVTEENTFGSPATEADAGAWVATMTEEGW